MPVHGRKAASLCRACQLLERTGEHGQHQEQQWIQTPRILTRRILSYVLTGSAGSYLFKVLT